jgi:hypothetical protein
VAAEVVARWPSRRQVGGPARRHEARPRGEGVSLRVKDTEGPRARHGAVDAVKGIAILFVLLLHALPNSIPYSLFWARQAVPLLVVMMGFTGAWTRIRPLGTYFRRRAVRLLVPWGIAWVTALAIVAVKGHAVWRSDILLGALPAPGPGNYFITIAFEFVVLLPLLRLLMRKSPWLMLGACLVVDLAFQLVFGYFDLNSYLFKASVFRYLFAAGLGMLLASGTMLWALVPVSVAYLVALTAGFRMPFIRPTWQSHFLLAAGYTSALVFGGLRLRYPRFLEEFGRASWHIFLVQIIWFGQVAHFVKARLGLDALPATVLSIAVCVVVGVSFARIEGAVTAWVRKALRARAEASRHA